ncbi:G3E family GTPase [Bacillus tianshenii]|uniref:G3E family GTPase n=1 Tax=Sutcliffiella tianshenii TaxID=1463404 RepID=A0ABS2P3I2_9BACI|nr:GTP-binding protein [Bacillus tianshenii]MBM7621439.1 G3E family GTPase [Bacillus tianshenii]
MNSNPKVPVYVISGFLGSGKTTVLLHMISHFRNIGKNPGIILNELGDENVENHLFEGQQVVELLNGCICCTIQDDLKTTLKGYINEEVDVLLIEGTGVANPLEIKDVLLDPLYLEHFELQSMISLVDASHYLEYQSFFNSSKEIRALLKEQVTSANILVLNKIDLVSEKELNKVEAKLADELDDHVPIYRTSFGEVPLELMLEKRFHVREVSHSHSTHELHHHHHHHIEATKLRVESPVKKDVLEKQLKKLSKHVIRAKGIIQLADDSRYFEFQYAAGQLRLNMIEKPDGLSPAVVLIGDKLEQDKVERFYKELTEQ